MAAQLKAMLADCGAAGVARREAAASPDLLNRLLLNFLLFYCLPLRERANLARRIEHYDADEDEEALAWPCPMTTAIPTAFIRRRENGS